jgi:glycosyltransferase involved in cell wall biosynthesis
MKKLPSLSIVFPAYNDALSLPSLIPKAYRTAKKVSLRHEIIVVNDGSQDETKSVLKNLSHKYPTVRPMNHTKNRGYGAAVRHGLAAAKKTWIFYTDGDGQYDPLELVSLVARVDDKIDVVNGYKIRRADSWMRMLVGDLYNGIVHMRYHLPIRDVDCDFRLMRASVVRKTTLKSSSGGFPLELVLALKSVGARWKEAPVHHYPRLHGASEIFSLRHIATSLLELFRVR